MNFDIRNEINNRRNNLLKSVENDSNIIIVNKYNIYYFTMFEGEAKALIYNNSNWYIITDRRFENESNFTSENTNTIIYYVDNIHTYNDYLKTLINPNLITYLEYNSISIYTYNELRSLFNNLQFGNIDSNISLLRQIKSEYEIEMISDAEEIGSKTFNSIIKQIKPGLTEIQIASLLELELKKYNTTKTSFDTIVATGINSSSPHSKLSNRVIESNDIITMDFGCIYNYYCSDMTRTIALGDFNDEYNEIYNILIEAQNIAFDNIKPGVIGSSIDKIARDYIESKGYGKYFKHSLGHSLGLEIHENPNFSPNCNDTILENMILSVEPGIYINNRFGIRVEDLILVTNNGYKNLTSAPKNLYN